MQVRTQRVVITSYLLLEQKSFKVLYFDYPFPSIFDPVCCFHSIELPTTSNIIVADEFVDTQSRLRLGSESQN